MKTIAIVVAAFLIAFMAYRLWAMLAKDSAALAAIPDDQLIGHYKWELAEGRDGKKYAAEYRRRHGGLPC